MHPSIVFEINPLAKKIFVGKRIRDLKFVESQNVLILALEDFQEIEKNDPPRGQTPVFLQSKVFKIGVYLHFTFRKKLEQVRIFVFY